MSQKEQGLLHSVEWPWCVACNKHAWIEVGFKLCHVAVKSPQKLQMLIGAPYCQQKSKSEPALQKLSGIQNRGTATHIWSSIYMFVYRPYARGSKAKLHQRILVGFSQDLLSSPEKPSFLTQYQEGDCVGREIGETKLSTSKSFDRMTARNQI